MNTLFQAIVVIGASVLISLLGFAMVNRLVPVDKRQRHNDVAGFIYAVVGPMYAILIAFVVFVVWGHYEEAKTVANSEANELTGLYHLAQGAGLPSDDALALKDAIEAYARDSVDDEWPRMSAGKTEPSPKVDKDFGDMRAVVYRVPVTNGAQQNFQATMLTEIHQIGSYRRTRLIDSDETLHPILWVVLVMGSAITIAYAYIFGVENPRSHALMIAVLAATVVGMLFMIKAIDGPFTGDVSVRPEALEVFLRSVSAG